MAKGLERPGGSTPLLVVSTQEFRAGERSAPGGWSRGALAKIEQRRAHRSSEFV